MFEFLEPGAMKFILVTAAVVAVVAIADVILLVRSRGTVRLAGFLPAVDSILVIAGFMAFAGTCGALISSTGQFAKWKGDIPFEFTLKVILTAFITTLVAWVLFFVFFEVWFLLRILYRKEIKKLPA